MDFQTLVFVIFIVWICTFITTNYRARSKLPPGPYGFPIIGSILDLGPKPHQSLAKLSIKYGPLMSLKLGSMTAIVVSSPETAKIVLQKHDQIFSSRSVPTAARSFKHHEISMAWLPAENKWRKLRKICREHMFSSIKLDASQGLRREKLQKLCDFVKGCCETGRAVDVGDATFTTQLNVISATLFSVEFAQFNTDSSHEIKDVVWGLLECVGVPNLADYFPILKFVDPRGILKQTDTLAVKLYAIFDEIIDQKLKSGDKRNDVLEAMIDINKDDEDEFTRNEIKHLLLDLFLAGTDTTGVTVEWAMAELLRNPDKMSRLRDDIGNFIGKHGQIEDSDIPRLPYLQAVVKETLRLHPPAPFLIPHKAQSDVETNDCIIPKNAKILVNIWAIGRDHGIWQNADMFMPERFLNDYEHIDFRGKNFELLPFGTGRRMCPGFPLAYRMLHLMLATLVGNFEWKLHGKKQEEIDMDEKFGLTLQKAMRLVAVPTKL